MQIEQQGQIRTNFFRRKPTAAERRARVERQREKARIRQARYRQGLQGRRAPELRTLAELTLAAFLSTATKDEDTRLIAHDLRRRIIAAGFDEREAVRRLRELRRHLLWKD